MPLLALTSGTVFVEETGQGQPLLLLHANPGDARDFDAVRPALAEHFRVISLSWPGYGQAPAPEPPASASVMLFAQLLQELAVAMDFSELVIIGNSVGAYAAVDLALAQPLRVQKLVLVAPGGFTAHNFFTRDFCRFKGREYVTRLLNGPLGWLYLRHRNACTQAMRARAFGEQRTPAAVAVNAALWRSFIAPEHDLRERARALRLPVLVLGGRYDPLIPAQDCRTAAALIPGAHAVILPCGHAPFAELPELFLDIVLPFIKPVPALRGSAA